MKIDTGGPAHPIVTPVPTVNGKGERIGDWVWDDSGFTEGMSLRDYFAGQALAGMLAFPKNAPSVHVTSEGWVEEAYKFADAMISEKRRSEEL